MIQEDFLYALAHSLHLLPFEGRKDSQTIFCTILRFRPPGSTAEISPALAYVTDERPEVIIELCRGYNHSESVMPCGVVLREIVKNEDVAQIILCDESLENEAAIRLNEIDENKPASGNGVFWKFFPCIDKAAFEVSADAFSTFRVSRLVASIASLALTPGSGDHHQTQEHSSKISERQLRIILRSLSQPTHCLQFLRDQTPIDQAARGNPSGQSELCRYDRIRGQRQAFEDLHESIEA